jgi:hypothetical protein
MNKQKMNRIMLNHLIFEGYESTAYQFAKEVGISLENDAELSVGLQSIGFRNQIKLRILKGEIAQAIDELNMEYPELLEQDDHLYFKLLLMNLIEMIRKHESNEEQFVLDIIKFAQDKLTNKAIKNPKFIEELELTMTLLLYSQNKELLPPKLTELFDVKLRRDIATLVNKALFKKDLKFITTTDDKDYMSLDSNLNKLLKFNAWADSTIQSLGLGKLLEQVE